MTAKAVGIGGGPSDVDMDVAADGPAPLLQPLQKRRQAGLSIRIVRGRMHQYADAAHPLRLLRARREWPHNSRAAKRGYEFSPSDVGCHVTLPWGVMPTQWKDDIT